MELNILIKKIKQIRESRKITYYFIRKLKSPTLIPINKL